MLMLFGITGKWEREREAVTWGWCWEAGVHAGHAEGIQMALAERRLSLPPCLALVGRNL